MPSPEQSEGGRCEEREPTPYYQASRFSGERAAGKAYAKAQHTIFTRDCDLSAYRFHIKEIWHVAILGERPDEAVEQKLQKILSAGEPVTLDPDVLKLLHERREQAKQQGSWVEGHYRPGKIIPPME